jgi:hypothetical protein
VTGTARHRFDDRGYIDRRIAAIGAEELAEPVRSLLGDAAARVTSWRHAPVGYDFLNPTSGGVYRFTGTADGLAGESSWRLVLKVTRSAASLVHDAPLPADLDTAVRWDRELLAYETGFLASLRGELVAARCHGGTRHEDGTGWLWLEEVVDEGEHAWTLDRWAHVARVLGTFNGAYASAPPAHEWLGERWLRVWVTQVTPFSFGASLPQADAWDGPRARAGYPASVRERLAALWADAEAMIAAVETLPRTLSHLDSHRRNLFWSGGAVVAIDWGLLGLAAPGEEIASTLLGTVGSGEAPVEEARDLTDALYTGYLEGLHASGWRGDVRDVRAALTVAAALRSFAAVRFDDSETVERAAAFTSFLLDLGDEARELL